MGSLASIAGFARHMGVHAGTVAGWLRAGVISNDGGGIDVETAEVAVEAWRAKDPVKRGAGRAPKAQTPGTLLDSKLRFEEARARKEELRVAEIEGRLIDRDLVRATVFEQARRTRNALLALPARLASQLASMTTARETSALLRAALLEVLAELGKAGCPPENEGDGAG